MVDENPPIELASSESSVVTPLPEILYELETFSAILPADTASSCTEKEIEQFQTSHDLDTSIGIEGLSRIKQLDTIFLSQIGTLIPVLVGFLYYGEKIAKREIEAPVIEQNIEK